jgi:hypothetical protein
LARSVSAVLKKKQDISDTEHEHSSSEACPAQSVSPYQAGAEDLVRADSVLEAGECNITLLAAALGAAWSAR